MSCYTQQVVFVAHIRYIAVTLRDGMDVIVSTLSADSALGGKRRTYSTKFALTQIYRSEVCSLWYMAVIYAKHIFAHLWRYDDL